MTEPTSTEGPQNNSADNGVRQPAWVTALEGGTDLDVIEARRQEVGEDWRSVVSDPEVFGEQPDRTLGTRAGVTAAQVKEGLQQQAARQDALEAERQQRVDALRARNEEANSGFRRVPTAEGLEQTKKGMQALEETEKGIEKIDALREKNEEANRGFKKFGDVTMREHVTTKRGMQKLRDAENRTESEVGKNEATAVMVRPAHEVEKHRIIPRLDDIIDPLLVMGSQK